MHFKNNTWVQSLNPSGAVLSVVVDNNVLAYGYRSAWGLSIHVRVLYEGEARELLFDVSGDFSTWQHNAKLLRIDLGGIDAIVISHWHGDHAGALDGILNVIGRDIPIYAPLSFRRIFRETYGVIECGGATEIFPGVFTTGTIGYMLAEHALAIKVRNKGLVVLVGCGHPGVAHLVRSALNLAGEHRVNLVIGGFHISSRSSGAQVASELKELGVERVSPMHCTGHEAKLSIKEVFGSRYIESGAGKVIVV